MDFVAIQKFLNDFKEIIGGIIFLVIVVVVILILVGPNTKTEGFNEDVRVVENEPISFKQTDIPLIDLPHNVQEKDLISGIIEAGTEYIPQKDFYTPWGSLVDLTDKKANSTSDDSAIVNGLNYNQCSMACCSAQWPVPFKVPVDESIEAHADDFVPTNYYCNNGWQNSGCVCMTKEQSQFLDSRGHNN